MNIKKSLLAVSTALISNGVFAAADLSALERDLDVNPVESCNEGVELYRSGDLKGALELIGLCHDEMMQISEEISAAAFVDTVLNFTGDPIRQQNALGFSQLERKYRSGDQVIDVTLSGGQAATMMQSVIAVSGKKIRLGKFTGFIISQNNDNSIYVTIDERALMFKTRTVDKKRFKKFSKEFLRSFTK